MILPSLAIEERVSGHDTVRAYEKKLMTHHKHVHPITRNPQRRRRERVALEDERPNDDANRIRPPPLVPAPAYRHQTRHSALPDVSQRHARAAVNGVLIERRAVLAVLDDRLAEPRAKEDSVSERTTGERAQGDLT